MPYADGQVGVAGVRAVAPTSLMRGTFRYFLGSQDQVNGFLTTFSQTLVLFFVEAHAKHFAQRQGDDAMTIHPATVTVAEVTVGVLVAFLQDKIKPPSHDTTFLIGIYGLVAHRRHGHERKGGHCGGVASVHDGAVGALFGHEKSNRLVDALVHLVLLEWVARFFLGSSNFLGSRVNCPKRSKAEKQNQIFHTGILNT